MATIRESQIPALVALLTAYTTAQQSEIAELDGDEAALVRNHRIERARIALENKGVQVTKDPVAEPPAPLPPIDLTEFGPVRGAA